MSFTKDTRWAAEKRVGKINPSHPKGGSWKYVCCCSYFALLASEVLILTLAPHGERLCKPIPTLLIMWLLKKRNPALFLCFQPVIFFKNLFGLLYLNLAWQGTYGKVLIVWKFGASICKERRKMCLSNIPIVKVCESNFWKS